MAIDNFGCKTTETLENSRFDIFRICGTEVAIYKYKIPIKKIILIIEKRRCTK